MSSSNSPESVPLTLYEKQNELQRILSSRHFSKAPIRRRFLEFTSGQTFLGEDSKLNEYLIGVEVYERGKDFDPQQDPIVRVQAHEIRRTLKNYYQEEGKDSLIRIELHPGHYAPVFKRVKLDGDASPTPAAGNGPAAEIHRHSFRWGYAVVVCLGLACVTLLSLYIRERFVVNSRLEPKAPASALAESGEWFWKPFLASGSEPLVIVPTPPLLRLATDGDTAETLRDGMIIFQEQTP